MFAAYALARKYARERNGLELQQHICQLYGWDVTETEVVIGSVILSMTYEHVGDKIA